MIDGGGGLLLLSEQHRQSHPVPDVVIIAVDRLLHHHPQGIQTARHGQHREHQGVVAFGIGGCCCCSDCGSQMDIQGCEESLQHAVFASSSPWPWSSRRHPHLADNGSAQPAQGSGVSAEGLHCTRQHRRRGSVPLGVVLVPVPVPLLLMLVHLAEHSGSCNHHAPPGQR